MLYNLNADYNSRTHTRLDALIQSQEEVSRKSFAGFHQEEEVSGSPTPHQDSAYEAAANNVEFNVGNYTLLENSMLNTPSTFEWQPGGGLDCGVSGKSS